MGNVINLMEYKANRHKEKKNKFVTVPDSRQSSFLDKMKEELSMEEGFDAIIERNERIRKKLAKDRLIANQRVKSLYRLPTK